MSRAVNGPQSPRDTRGIVHVQSEAQKTRKLVSAILPKATVPTRTSSSPEASSKLKAWEKGDKKPHTGTGHPEPSRGVQKSKSFDPRNHNQSEKTPSPSSQYNLPPRGVPSRGIGKSRSFDPRSKADRYYGTSRYGHVMGYDQPDGIMKPPKRVMDQKFPKLFRSSSSGSKSSIGSKMR